MDKIRDDESKDPFDMGSTEGQWVFKDMLEGEEFDIQCKGCDFHETDSGTKIPYMNIEIDDIPYRLSTWNMICTIKCNLKKVQAGKLIKTKGKKFKFTPKFLTEEKVIIKADSEESNGN